MTVSFEIFTYKYLPLQNLGYDIANINVYLCILLICVAIRVCYYVQWLKDFYGKFPSALSVSFATFLTRIFNEEKESFFKHFKRCVLLSLTATGRRKDISAILLCWSLSQ